MIDYEDGRPPDPFGFRFLAPLALGAMLNPINSTMISTALVPIAESLHADVAETSWLIAALYLTSAIAQPAMGRMVDLFGARRIYLLSLAFVAMAGVMGWRMSSLAGLVMVRVLLGIGTSGAYPAVMRMFRVQADRTGAAPPRAAIGILSFAAIATTAIGPLMGGVLTGAFGWHAIFTVNGPLALLAALLILLWVPADPPQADQRGNLRDKLDVVGFGLFAVSLLSLMAFLMHLQRPLWLALTGAVGFGGLLVAHSLRRRQPFIDVRMLMRNRPLTVTYGRAGINALVIYSVYYGVAQWLQSGIGLASAEAGLLMLPMSVVAAVSSLTGGRTGGLRGLFLISIGAAVAGCAGLLFITSQTSVWIVALAVMPFGVPLGMFSTATQAAIYLQAPAGEIGAAAGLQRTAQYIGAIAAAGLLAVMFGQRAGDDGLHRLAIVMGVLSAVLFLAILVDRTIPRKETAA